jgi:hypothetical protein
MQDPQSYEDDAGNVYVREGNRWRVIRGQQARAPSAPAMPPIVPMTTPAEARAAEQQTYQRGRDEVRDAQAAAREERANAAAALQADAARRTAEKLTEDQGKAGGYAKLMADAEASYQRALDAGFNPTGWQAGVSNFVEGIPLIGGAAPFIRDDAGDIARQAELQWTDAQLKAMSGAASPEQEVARNNITFFARPGQNYAAIGGRLEDAREVAFESSRRRAGADLAGLDYPTDDDPLSIAGYTNEQLLALQPGQRILGQDGQTVYVLKEAPYADPDTGLVNVLADRAGPNGGPPAGPGGAPSGPGGGSGPGPDGFTRESAQDARTAQGEGAFRKVDAGVRGAADVFTFGLSDEIVAGLNTVLPLDAGSQSIWSTNAGDAYRHNLAMQRGIDDADKRDVPVSRGTGQVAAGVAVLPRTVASAGGRALAGANALERGALAGSAYGAAYGFGSGEGSAAERLPSMGQGAALGGAAGVAAPPVANALGRAASPIASGLAPLVRGTARPFVNALGDNAPIALREAVAMPTPLQTGVRKFGNLSPQNLDDMAGRGNALSAEAIEPTFVDLVNDGGRGVLRSAATRQTMGRDRAREFAEGRVESLPGRISSQARRIVSPDARPVQQIVDDLTAARANQARTTYAEPYAQTTRIDPETAQALSGAPGRAALTRARAAAEAFNDTQAMAEIDALAAGQANEVSAGTLDRIRQAMSGRAESLSQNPGTRAVGAGVAQRAQTIDGALDNVPGLSPARDAYRQASQQIEATEAGGRFMQANPDDMSAAVQGLTPDQMQPVRAAVARNIEITARQPGSAPTVARRLYADNEIVRPGGMGEAVLGADAQRLAQAARMEALAVRNAIEVNPRAGSPTNLNREDTLTAAGEALGAVRDVATGNWLSLAPRAWRAVTGQGINDNEAAAILDAAVDPARTQEVVDMLSRHMSRREARNLARAIRYQLTTGPQSGQQG